VKPTLSYHSTVSTLFLKRNLSTYRMIIYTVKVKTIDIYLKKWLCYPHKRFIIIPRVSRAEVPRHLLQVRLDESFVIIVQGGHHPRWQRQLLRAHSMRYHCRQLHRKLDRKIMPRNTFITIFPKLFVVTGWLSSSTICTSNPGQAVYELPYFTGT